MQRFNLNAGSAKHELDPGSASVPSAPLENRYKGWVTKTGSGKRTNLDRQPDCLIQHDVIQVDLHILVATARVGLLASAMTAYGIKFGSAKRTAEGRNTSQSTGVKGEMTRF